MLTETELQRRKPVWTALSELWLDTELTGEDLRRISTAVTHSGYTVPELREIYLFEIAPVVWTNSWSVAGEWAGFDDDWLCSEARRRAEQRSFSLRFWVWARLGRWVMTYASERHCLTLLKFIAGEIPPTNAASQRKA